MKQIAVAAALILLCCSYLSCKHDPIQINTEGVYLLAIESPRGLTDKPAVRYSFEYDDNGRITKIFFFTDSIPVMTLYDISYVGNEILMTNPSDTIHLFLDGNNNVVQRIFSSFHIFIRPDHTERHIYNHDTAYYQYNGDGLLTRQTYDKWKRDTFTAGPKIDDTTICKGEVNYAITDRDVTDSKDSAQIEYRAYTEAGTSTYRKTAVTTSSYQYFKLYQNKTDFSNSAVLNELNVYSLLPLNEGYAHLPNNVYIYYMERDEFNNTNSSNYSISNEFDFNSYRFMESRTGPNLPLEKLSFVYNR